MLKSSDCRGLLDSPELNKNTDARPTHSRTRTHPKLDPPSTGDAMIWFWYTMPRYDQYSHSPRLWRQPIIILFDFYGGGMAWRVERMTLLTLPPINGIYDVYKRNRMPVADRRLWLLECSWTVLSSNLLRMNLNLLLKYLILLLFRATLLRSTQRL